MIKVIALLVFIQCAFGADCENSGDVQAIEECQCGQDNCSVGQYCMIDFCSDYSRCQCHSTHGSVKSASPRDNPVCKDPLDPSCQSSIEGSGGVFNCPDEEETLCIIAIPPCGCLNDAIPWSPAPALGLPGFELNKFSCFDPQYRHQSEMEQADVYDTNGELVHRLSDGKHKCFDQPEAYDAVAGVCKGTTRRRCRMPADVTDAPTESPTVMEGSPSPHPTTFYPTPDPTLSPTLSPTLTPTYPVRTSRGYMVIEYDVNIKTPQTQMEVSGDEDLKTSIASTSVTNQARVGFKQTGAATTDAGNILSGAPNAAVDLINVHTDEQDAQTIAGASGHSDDQLNLGFPDDRRAASQIFKSPVFFGIALAAIGFGFGIAGYYTTKMVFKRTDGEVVEKN